MLFLIKEKANADQLEKASEDLGGYIKFVIDIEEEIMTIGGARNVEGEELLLENGSRQQNLWGGGFDVETNEVDYDSMINIRPNQGNTSREVLSAEIRKKMDGVLNKLIK